MGRLREGLTILTLFLLSATVHGFRAAPSSSAATRRQSVAINSKGLVRSPSEQQHRTKLQAWPKDRDPKGMVPDVPSLFTRITVTSAATVLTWYAHGTGLCSPVLSSAAVSLAGSLIAPGLGQAAMCGSFAGMSSTSVLPTFGHVMWAGGLTAVLFESVIHRKNAFLGLGGRLGLLGFIAVNVVAAVARITTNPLASVPSLSSVTMARSTLYMMSAYAALGSVATIALRESSDDKAASDPVRACAVVGLLAALLVGSVPGYGDMGALAAYGGAFAGMSLPSRLLNGVVPGRKEPRGAAASVPPSPPVLLMSFGLAGALGGIVHGLTVGWKWWTVPAGWGVKAGFCSFLGVLLYRGLSKAVGQLVGRWSDADAEPAVARE